MTFPIGQALRYSRKELRAGRILICAVQFPPHPGPHAQRVFHFSRFLASRGWHVSVVAADVSALYPGTAPWPKYEQVGPRLQVYRTPFDPVLKVWRWLRRAPKRALTELKDQPTNHGPDLNVLAHWYERLRRQLLFPDPRVVWLPSAVRVGKPLASLSDLVLSSAIPFTSHLIGYTLSRQARIPWVADYGDPFSDNPGLNFPNWHNVPNHHLERYLLKQMDKITVTTEETRSAYLAAFPFLTTREVEVIQCGYNPQDFDSIIAETCSSFRIVYTGAFYKDIRDPSAFFRGVAQANALCQLPGFEVVVAGDVSKELLDYTAQLGLQGVVSFLGLQPRRRTLALQKGASVLLLLGNKGGLQLPAKLFEYMGAQRPILFVRNDERDPALGILQTMNRALITPNQPDSIAQALIDLYNLWQSRELERRFDLRQVNDYTWEAQGRKLEQIVLSLLTK